MSTVKTAISLEDTLLQQIDRVANELSLPRSRFMAIAAEAFLKQHENTKLLAALNEAHSDEPTAEELEIRRAWKRKHLSRIKDTW